MSWTTRAEAAIRALRDVDGATIQLEGDEIREIHVLTHSKRPAKQIVRDVQTVLMTLFNRSFDYRVVSVAYTKSGEGGSDRAPTPGGAAAASDARVMDQPREARGDSDFETESAERIRFASVNLFVSGPRTQAQVELRWKGLARMGSASGWSSRDGAHPLIAQATLAAVQEFLAGETAFNVQAVEFVRMGRRRVALVALALLAGREERPLFGSCAVEQDAQQAVVLATLAALNRVIGGLPTREPTEYVLRPTSN
ncbi:MAG: hypothetical protein HY076_08695 [Candidatus Eisenbacteria bacterium]|uniref:2-isopropylmalate synthase LeuA allosteric (dimerisation) domain-containing protein n=1 Tax=Eiseniibacteriota bacterium TaxID=2212470 RepID=A0A9D6L9K5_UNCEI|nr:hypothetical protein [Candidatus Eisenbacteria bacterium]MBI3540334.1 hypothetical protein [Candidatus Eisenbacteria bacterium]